MKPMIQMDVHHYQIVKNILDRYNIKVKVFGSRATGKANKFSDLDLVILKPIEKSTFIAIKNDFEDSNLPYKVDLIQWDDLDESFQQQKK